jgi:ATP-dependent helicase/nuclease subunit A
MANILPFPTSAPTSEINTNSSAPDLSHLDIGVPTDAPARQQALDTRASWIVEAPAGSGKTGLLMQRYLKLLAEPEVAQPEEVLAITFTRKATAELRARILHELEFAWADKPLADPTNAFAAATREFAQAALLRDNQLGWQLLENPHRLRIRTIDSVCTEIANSLPLLSGSGAGRTPVEDADPLYLLAARRTLLQLGGSDTSLHNALRTVLLHRDASFPDCERLLTRMLATREQWAELVPLDRASLTDDILENEVRPRLERSLETIVCSGLTRAVNALPAPALQELTQLAQRLSIEPGYKGAESPIAFCTSRNEPPESRVEHLNHWIALIDLLLTKDGSWRRGFAVNHIGFTAPKPAKQQLEILIADLSTDSIRDALCSVRDLPPARYPDEQWHVAKALFRLLLHALAELKVLFAERSECDFVEYALAAREALHTDTGAADLATASGATLRHLLVDEMQDTSSSQYELIHLLTRSWDGHSQTLFLVGDPKQSIYLFRQARVERFLRTMREACLGEVPLGVLQLTSNFRSQAALVESFNADFGLIFPSTLNAASGEAIDVPFVAATPTRSTSAASAIVWHTEVLSNPQAPTNQPVVASHSPNSVIPIAVEKPASPSAPGNSAGTLGQEARTIRNIVEHWQGKELPDNRKRNGDTPEKPWKIAVLARTRKHLAPILAEFQRSDDVVPIPYRAVNVEALGDRSEVLDVLALTRALLHPADRVAWLAVLHAPWCGLGLADLLALTGEASTENNRLIISALAEARAQYLSPEGQMLLHRAWPTLQTAAAERGRSNLTTLVARTWRSLGGDSTLTADQLTNVEHFFSLLRSLEQPGAWVDLPTLQQKLDRLFAESTASPNAVDLMTIHTAKGLEWDVVLVPALEKKGQSSRSDLLNWLELDEDSADDTVSSVVLAPIYGKGSDPDKLYTWLNKVRNAREAAERKRLYYVACTRAREELHLFATCKRDASGELKPAPGTLLQSCWPAAARHFEPATSTTADQLRRSIFDEHEGEAAEPAYEQTLALAASAQPASKPLIHRLPLTFNPLQRFTEAAANALPYLPTSALKQSPTFDRPEGSFAVRAFGNVVHRYLQLLSNRLTTTPSHQLLAELPTWEPRLLASLRGEGLSPTQCQREASRALAALTSALNDSTGLWILSPQPSATTERTLTSVTAPTLRVDRTFLAAASPLTAGDTHLWIVDFKTTEQGSRTSAKFESDERSKYTAQLESYATAQRTLNPTTRPIILALYYPLIPRLIHWPAATP